MLTKKNPSFLKSTVNGSKLHISVIVSVFRMSNLDSSGKTEESTDVKKNRYSKKCIKARSNFLLKCSVTVLRWKVPKVVVVRKNALEKYQMVSVKE